MDQSGRKRLRGPAYGEAPQEKVKTIVDDHVKKLLGKQLNTKMNLTE